MKKKSFESAQKVTIRDLCAEDKKKIGNLVRRLAQEREEKEQLLQRLEKMNGSGSKRIQTEIEKLDQEILLLQEGQDHFQQTHQSQQKQKFNLYFNNEEQGSKHQSPNFKIQNPMETSQNESSSFILPITETRRESPQKVDQMIQTSMMGQSKRVKSSTKKQILMQKIQEFEKIVNRLNFSNEQSFEITNRKSVESNNNQNNNSYLQSVYQKLMNLESQLQQMPQSSNSERNSVQFQSREDEDDFIIQLLNHDNHSYDYEKYSKQTNVLREYNK